MKKTLMALTVLCVSLVSVAPSFASIIDGNCPTDNHQVPEPATLLMLGSAAASMFLLKNRFRKEK